MAARQRGREDTWTTVPHGSEDTRTKATQQRGCTYHGASQNHRSSRPQTHISNRDKSERTYTSSSHHATLNPSKTKQPTRVEKSTGKERIHPSPGNSCLTGRRGVTMQRSRDCKVPGLFRGIGIPGICCHCSLYTTRAL